MRWTVRLLIVQVPFAGETHHWLVLTQESVYSVSVAERVETLVLVIVPLASVTVPSLVVVDP